jgi:hypothetical protein
LNKYWISEKKEYFKKELKERSYFNDEEIPVLKRENSRFIDESTRLT